MNKFGSLSANTEQTFKVVLISPYDDLPIADKSGKEAYIEVLSSDSDIGRAFDKNRRQAAQQRAMRGRSALLAQDDPLEENQAKLSKLTRSWHLVDPSTKEVLTVPCTEQNALELYSDGGAQWIFRQTWLGAIETANFIRKPSKGSSSTQSTLSDSTVSEATAQASGHI